MGLVAIYSPEKLCRLPLHDYYERINVPFVERDGWLVPKRFQAIGDEVMFLERGNGIVDFSDHGLLRIEGKDAVDFLHRISTNDFGNLRPGGSLQTILVNEKGRMIDSVVVAHKEDYLLMVVSRGAHQQVSQWIEKFIITEDVRVSDLTGKHLLFAAFHPQHTLDTSAEGSTSYSFRAKYFDDEVVFYFGDTSAGFPDRIRPPMYTQVGTDAFEFYCIQHGIPLCKREITGEFNPLDLNLWKQISFSKGCYIGQEVIARLDTYGKIQRKLCRFRSDGRLLPDTEYRLGLGKEEIGKIVSHVPDVGNENISIGLAVIKNKYADAGARYSTADSAPWVKLEFIFERNEKHDGNNNNSR